MTQTLDLPPADRAILSNVLRTYLPEGVTVWAFGSRVTGSARRYSDLDIAVEAATPLSPYLLRHLRDALSESDLTVKVDVVDLRGIDPGFRRSIESTMARLEFTNTTGPD